MPRKEEDVRVNNVIRERATAKAWLCRLETDLMHENEFWLPCSQIVDTSINDENDLGWVVIPHWLAKEKGFA